MKKWKKPLSVLLALVMVCSALSAAFMASAKEEFQYPEGVTEEKVTNTIAFLDKAALDLIKPETGVYTNYTVNLILKTVLDLIDSLAGGQINISPNSLWMATGDIQPNPLEENRNDQNWDNIKDIQSLKWFEDGNKEAFFKTMYAVLRPLGSLLGMLSVPDSDTPDTSMGIPAPLYRYVFYPIFTALELPDVITPEEYFKSHAATAIDLEAYTAAAEAYGAAVMAFEEAKASGDTAKIDAARAALPAASKAYYDMDGLQYAPMFNPILKFVEELLTAPLTVLIDKLPNLDELVKSGAIDFVYPMLFPNMTEKPANLVDLLNLVFGTLPIINNQPLGLELTAFDAAALKDNSPEERFIIVLRYLIDNIKMEKNLNAITALVGNDPQIANILALVPNLETDALIGMVVALANPEPDTTTEPDTTEPTQSGDPTTATDPTDSTNPTDPTSTTAKDTPDTGDAAIGALAAVSLAAAAAFVLTAKKKVR